MVLIVHQKGVEVLEVIKDGQSLSRKFKSCTNAFWMLAKEFPDELIAWCEIAIKPYLNIEKWDGIFQHNLIMASYTVNSVFIPKSVGYVDQLPFANPRREILYPTWIMSTDVGGIYGKTATQFYMALGKFENFGYLINSISKIGQQNSLFCYNAPDLLKIESTPNSISTCDNSDVFKFVSQHYKKVRLLILFLCFFRYEKKLPIFPLLRNLFTKSFFNYKVELPDPVSRKNQKELLDSSIDVVIPTLGRPEYLRHVLVDLKNQLLKPVRVIIVEQDPNPESNSNLDFLKTEAWPFLISHHFTHQTGACNARNIALKKVEANWTFLADDDIRIDPNFLLDAMEEANRLKLNCINFNIKQPGEKTIFKKIKQWGSFGSGTSLVRSNMVKKCEFSMVFEHGYGEDADFGMQLRENGCDIIYHPQLELLHLKAPVGGLRTVKVKDWESEEILPKPSPTLMALALKYYSREQILGYKVSLFIKYYNNQPIKNPFTYLQNMKSRWRKSNLWAERLLREENVIN